MVKLRTDNINPKHLAHIVCVDAMHFVNRSEDGFCDFTLEPGDIIIARRHELERDYRFRQVMPMLVFTHKGKIWAYRRTEKGGEKGLHNKVAVVVGGHFDLGDLVYNKSVIDLEKSLENATAREIDEEVLLNGANVVSQTKLDKVITADVTGVDAKHVALVTMIELDAMTVESKEDELESLGFFSPDELLNGDYALETWATMICKMM